MAGELGPRGLYDYTSDDTSDYCVRMRTALATAGGFSTSTSNQPNYPRAWRMRYVLGSTSGGLKKKLHIQGPSETLFVSGGTFTVSGNTFTVQGAVGEKRHG